MTLKRRRLAFFSFFKSVERNSLTEYFGQISKTKKINPLLLLGPLDSLNPPSP
jgi:hypothetical protein